MVDSMDGFSMEIIENGEDWGDDTLEPTIEVIELGNLTVEDLEEIREVQNIIDEILSIGHEIQDQYDEMVSEFVSAIESHYTDDELEGCVLYNIVAGGHIHHESSRLDFNNADSVKEFILQIKQELLN